jgi:uncharacterized phage-associated protein
MSVLIAARTLGEESGWRLTPIEYQKMLYVAQMLHLDRESRPLFPERFEAWDHGPVVPVLYRALKSFGRTRVTEIAAASVFAWGTPGAAAVVDAYCMTQHMTPGQLINFTHRSGGAWESYYELAGENAVIPPNAMVAEWKEFARPSTSAIRWAEEVVKQLETAPSRYLDDADEHAFRARLFDEDRK